MKTKLESIVMKELYNHLDGEGYYEFSFDHPETKEEVHVRIDIGYSEPSIGTDWNADEGRNVIESHSGGYYVEDCTVWIGDEVQEINAYVMDKYLE